MLGECTIQPDQHNLNVSALSDIRGAGTKVLALLIMG